MEIRFHSDIGTLNDPWRGSKFIANLCLDRHRDILVYWKEHFLPKEIKIKVIHADRGPNIIRPTQWKNPLPVLVLRLSFDGMEISGRTGFRPSM